MKIRSAVARAFATILPAFLGQGLIYLCIAGEISVLTAIVTIGAMGAVILAVAAAARSWEEEKLVKECAPSPFLRRRLQPARS